MTEKAIKDLLQGGCKVSIPFKAQPDSWVNEAKLVRIPGYQGQGLFIYQSPVEYKEFQLDQIDEAVSHFMTEAFGPKNYFYMVEEAQIQLGRQGEYGDMDDPEWRDRVYAYRDQLLSEANGDQVQ